MPKIMRGYLIKSPPRKLRPDALVNMVQNGASVAQAEAELADYESRINWAGYLVVDYKDDRELAGFLIGTASGLLAAKLPTDVRVRLFRELEGVIKKYAVD